MSTTILWNGSKFAGEEPDPIERRFGEFFNQNDR